tara:strand:+ start:826 stop:1260 length:435 start_codon:yes stop_codon:yes gene_type:complete
MATIQLDFPHEINVSVQVGDLVYWVPTVPVGVANSNPLNAANGPWESTTTPHDSAPREDVILIGPVLEFIPWDGTTASIIADYADSIAEIYGPPQVTDFIMFSKDNKVNLSSLLGYYSRVQFRNNSTSEAELFAVGTDFVESSK